MVSSGVLPVTFTYLLLLYYVTDPPLTEEEIQEAMKSPPLPDGPDDVPRPIPDRNPQRHAGIICEIHFDDFIL